MNTDQIIDKLYSLGYKIKHIQYNKFIRCSTLAHPKKRNGWIYLTETQCSYGDWASNDRGYFYFNDTPLTEEQKFKYKAERIQLATIEMELRQTEIDKYVSLKNVFMTYLMEHPYLDKKNIKLNSGMFIDKNNCLQIPVFNIHKKQTGVQLINANCEKRFKTGSIIKGSFYPILAPVYTNDRNNMTLDKCKIVFLVEGVATGLSLRGLLRVCIELYLYDNDDGIYEYDLSNSIILCCMNARNINNVYEEVKTYNSKLLVIGVFDADDHDVGIHIDGITLGTARGEDINDLVNKYDALTLVALFLKHLEQKYHYELMQINNTATILEV
jgi:hypothetical protein